MNSIRRHLATSLLAGFGLLWCAGAATVYLATRAMLVEEFDSALDARAQAIISLTEQEGAKVVLEDAATLDPLTPPRHARQFFQMRFNDGAVVMRSHSLAGHDLPRLDASDKLRFANLALQDGKAGRAAVVRFMPRVDPDVPQPTAGALPKAITLVVAVPRGDLDRTLNTLLAILFGVAALASAATVLLIKRVVRAGLAPVTAIAERATTIDAGSLSQRFSTDTMPSELQPICARFNDLLARLETSFDRERRFSADVAHELRTPIAELRSLAEVALRWPDDASATAKTVEDARQIALQMEALVTRLLAMMRCEAGNQLLQREPVCVTELVAEVLRPFQPQVDMKQLAVTLAVPASVSMFTDRAVFQSILANLLANAVEYTPPRGKLDVRFVSDGGHFTLTVANTVTDVTSDDLPHLFERFWRKDAARSGTNHCGLGLALSQTFARALGLRLSAGLTAPDMLTLTLDGATGGAAAHRNGHDL